jgi:hypothetical protein
LIGGKFLLAMQSIKNIVKVEPFHLILEFDKNEIRKVNLEPEFRKWSKTPESKFKELLNPEQFKKVRLNKEIESIYWENGIDLCPDVLYSLSKGYL